MPTTFISLIVKACPPGLRLLLFSFSFIISNRIAAQEAASPSTLPDIRYHLTARPWKALNTSNTAFLDRVEGIVRTFAIYQDASGAIIDPYARREVQYATPYFANALGTLLSAGRAMDLLQKGVLAMNKATTDVAGGADSIPDNHGEFFIAPLANAIPLYAPFVSSTQLEVWKTRMATPLKSILNGKTHNWQTYAMKGEWYRARNGYVDKPSAVTWIENSWLKTQKSRFTNNSWNLYHDKTSNPDTWPYDAVARSNLLAMIADGYDGVSRSEIVKLLKRGTQSSLLLQDPSGQIAAGGRSTGHTWNDILLANGYETMAEMAYKEGNTRLAGQYRRAANLAFQSVQRWRRIDGTYSVTKNHFDPAKRIRYASYSFFSNYNGNMMYHLAENYLRRKTGITEQPSPTEIGGYTFETDTAFATAVANAGGMYMELCLKGAAALNQSNYWTALGVLRFARPGWDSRLGPSDGIRASSSKLGISFAPTFFENGSWVRLASIPERYEGVFTTQFVHPLLVRCQVVYKPKTGQTGPSFTNKFILTPDGILSQLSSDAPSFGMTWPVLTYDGTTQLNTKTTSHITSISFPNASDQQNFIALHPSPTITTTEGTLTSAYGYLRPVRMVSGTKTNVTFIYPRNAADPSADSVRKHFVQAGDDFSSPLGSVKGTLYVGRTAAGGVGTSIDLDQDSLPEAVFSTATGFLMQLKVGEITKVESDRDVTAVIYGQTVKLKAYTPVDITNPLRIRVAKVVASADDGNKPGNTVDRDYATRWSAYGNNQWIRYLLDSAVTVTKVKIAWYKGNERKASFDIQTSSDSINWKTVYSGASSGTTTAFESYTIAPARAVYIRILGHGNSLDRWNAITEAEFIKDTGQHKSIAEVMTVAAVQLDSAQAFPDKTYYPRSTNPDGTVKRVRASDWTSGFFPGSLWYLYENTKNATWRTRAEAWTAGLESQKFNTSTHDVGFMLFSSFGQGYRLTGNQKYRDILLQAAASLATRFNATVGCIKSWNTTNYNFPVIIDNMMNLEILFWATKMSGDSSYHKMAVTHALTTIANHFRADNSSYHLVDYDPNTGNVLTRITVQGLHNSSDWARGQAWGLYGFTICYRETKDVRFLAMAKKIADFYISHPNMPSDWVPYWDFDAFDYRDASAACIASAALLELSQYVPEKRNVYYHFGTTTLNTLSSATYLANKGTNNYFILQHSVGNKPANTEVDKPLNFADYYFIESLLRQKKPAPFVTAQGGNNSITLIWNASTGARYYSIDRSEGSGGPFTTIATRITDTKYINNNLSAGKTYYYKVTPRDDMGEGETSDEVKAMPKPPCSATGSFTRELWTNISGNSVSLVPLDKPPTSTTQLTSLETPTNAASNYGQRLRGYICAPVSGAYTFYIASDDNSELWLSRSNNPAAKISIASVTGWTNPREWTKFASQQSAAITLQAGQSYYIEVLHKEGSGGDNLAVGWITPGSSSIAVIPGSVLSPFAAQPLTVSLRASLTGDSIMALASILLSTDAQKAEGTITRVEFFQDTTLIDSVYAAPLSFTLRNVPPAIDTLTTNVTNDRGNQSIPVPETVSVNNSVPEITGLTLVNASTNQDIDSLNDGDVIDLALTTAINIRANIAAGGRVGSVRFDLNNKPINGSKTALLLSSPAITMEYTASGR